MSLYLKPQWDWNGLTGPSRNRLRQFRGDPGCLRPWDETDKHGRPTGRVFITVANRTWDGSEFLLDKDGKPTYRHIHIGNAPVGIPREAWVRIDETVNFVQRDVLRVWSDIAGLNPLVIPNGFGTLLLQHSVAKGDPSATMSMDPVYEGERWRPEQDFAYTPLPVQHADGGFTAREQAVSENSGLPLDTTTIRLSTRKLLENVEDLALGTAASFSFAGGTIYGLTNHPGRITKVLTTPNGTNGATVVNEIIDMLATLRTRRYNGPYIAYYSKSYDKWFDMDYTTTYQKTLRGRLNEITDIRSWRSVDRLSGYQIVIVDPKREVVEGIIGMPLRVVRWTEAGGMEERWKIMSIYVPRVRADADGYVGINHGTAP